jgi:hypothetical protein
MPSPFFFNITYTESISFRGNHQERSLQNEGLPWSLRSNDVVRSMASNPEIKKRPEQCNLSNVRHMSGFRSEVDNLYFPPEF